MTWKTPPQPELPQAAFAMFFALLCDIVCTEGSRLGIGSTRTIQIWQRLCRLAVRFTWLVAHGPASLRARPERRASPTTTKAAAKKPENQPLPRSFGWLNRTMPSEQFAAARLQLNYLLNQTYLVDLVEANPTLCQVLRPLCHMLGTRLPALLKITRPAAPAPATAPGTSKPATSPPPIPRHPPSRHHSSPPDPNPVAALADYPYRQKIAC